MALLTEITSQLHKKAVITVDLETGVLLLQCVPSQEDIGIVEIKTQMS